MKDIKIKATFINSDRIIYFELSDVIYKMGKQCAEELDLEEEIGEDMAYLQQNWKNIILEIIK